MLGSAKIIRKTVDALVMKGLMSHRVKFSSSSGSHCAEIDDSGNLLVEWYDFGDDAPYESANILQFAEPSQRLLALALDGSSFSAPDEFLQALANRFSSYFEIRRFADLEGIPYVHKVNFSP